MTNSTKRVAREDQWARQHDVEIIERLRRKYVKPIQCPQCGKNLEARGAIGTKVANQKLLYDFHALELLEPSSAKRLWRTFGLRPVSHE